MSKRRSNNEEAVSLFPFMSILACLIGILTLMISVSMQVKQIENDDRSNAEKALALDHRELTARAKSISETIKANEARLEAENSTAAILAEVRDRKILLTKELEEVKKAATPEESDAALQKAVENWMTEIGVLRRDRPPLQKQLDELNAELAKRQNPPERIESVVIRPGGSGIRAASRLFFVECNSTGIVIMNGNGADITVSTAAIDANPEYAAFLANVKNTRDSMVLFLMRSTGYPAYAWAAGIAENRYEIKTGKIPVPNEGKIDTSLFNNP